MSDRLNFLWYKTCSWQGRPENWGLSTCPANPSLPVLLMKLHTLLTEGNFLLGLRGPVNSLHRNAVSRDLLRLCTSLSGAHLGLLPAAFFPCVILVVNPSPAQRTHRSSSHHTAWMAITALNFLILFCALSTAECEPLTYMFPCGPNCPNVCSDFSTWNILLSLLCAWMVNK